MKAVNARQVGRRILADAVLRFFDEIVAIAKLGGARRTNLRAGRLFAGNHAVRAHNAFAHSRIQRIPFVFRLGKRARYHAVPAADALPDVVYDRAFLRLVERTHWTSRGASRMLTVHAQPAHELIVLGHDDRILVFRLRRLCCYRVVIGQLVLFRAGLFTLLATDAHGRVIEQGLTHGNFSSLLPSGIFVPAE